ncbi:MAG: pilus assembly protein PilZ, partial [Treponema sp. GWA1_62_8]
IKATGLVAQQVFLKCVGETWPCVIFSSSFESARIIVSARTGLHEKIQGANGLVQLRYSFREADKVDPMLFFVSARVAGSAPYGGSPDIAMLTMAFTKRPPDDLIEIMGRLLDANFNSSKRREERIFLSVDTMRRMRMVSKEIAMFIDGVPRRCILRDISFSGAKIIIQGIPKYLLERDASIRIDFEDPRESVILKGRTVRAEDVEGRKDLVAIAMVFDEQAVPMTYKMRVNDFLSQVRADTRGDQAATPATGAE